VLRYDEHTGTLEQKDHTFDLQEVEKPEYFEDIFPCGDVPKIAFNHRHVPMQPAKKIWVSDTTFRDGQQAMPPFSVRQIVDLYRFMHRLGGENGFIRQCEFFLYERKDREAVEKCLELGYRFPEVTAWIRAHPGDFKLVKEMGLKETGILTSCSDYHPPLPLRGYNARRLLRVCCAFRAGIAQTLRGNRHPD